MAADVQMERLMGSPDEGGSHTNHSPQSHWSHTEVAWPWGLCGFYLSVWSGLLSTKSVSLLCRMGWLSSQPRILVIAPSCTNCRSSEPSEGDMWALSRKCTAAWLANADAPTSLSSAAHKKCRLHTDLLLLPLWDQPTALNVAGCPDVIVQPVAALE